MQFIKKENVAPAEWANFFLDHNGKPSFVYATPSRPAKEILAKNQHYLCAYCQRSLTGDNMTIEHVVPNSYNGALATSYYNLVAVCTNFRSGKSEQLFCEKARGNALLPNFILYSNCAVTDRTGHPYFECYTDGTVAVNPRMPSPVQVQVQAFIDILNLNHPVLKDARSQIASKILEKFTALPVTEKRRFLETEFNRILAQDTGSKTPFRQFLLSILARKLSRQ
jgi:uncharacterized protein (TIGR02646 family)